MTIFAGAFCLGSTNGLPQGLRESLAAHLRNGSKSDGQRHVHDTQGMFLVKWDSGAFAEPAWRPSTTGSVSALVGDPLFIENGCRPVREQQLQGLTPEANQLGDLELAKCRGSFALVRYDENNKTLHLATDAIGLRSVYYVVQDGVLIFATALRVLEAMPDVRKQLCLLGMSELSVLGFPLAERTPYEGIKVLRECQVLTANERGVKLHNYYDWNITEPCADSPAAAAAQIYKTFQDAVRMRAGNDKRVYSFLSGGMDSRAIVATLVGMGRQVEALNFSAEASQDQLYGQLLAAEAGLNCRLHCLKGGNYPNFSFLALAAKTDLEHRESTSVDRPQFIWSGDGGSVGLGHVYMDEHMLDCGDRGDLQGAIKYFLEMNRIALPSGILTTTARKLLPNMLFDSVMAEVDRYPREDIGRRIYLFLLFNDQRRHLFKHFETIDQHGLELLTPFYDSEFLKAIAATPARWGILHRLYTQLFELLPAFARKTPWQTYPGHVPCPLPRDPRASYQWDSPAESHKQTFVERGKQAIELVGSFSRSTQPKVFSESRIWLAGVAHALGLRDCRHLIQPLQTYKQYDAKTHRL